MNPLYTYLAEKFGHGSRTLSNWNKSGLPSARKKWLAENGKVIEVGGETLLVLDRKEFEITLKLARDINLFQKLTASIEQQTKKLKATL